MDRDTGALTGIRGVAALWIVAHHLLGNIGLTPLHHFIVKGYLAVDLFFVLSGFVIALNHGAAFAAGARRDLCLAFFRQRVKRVYPLLAFVIVLALSFDVASGDPLPSIGTLLADLTMTQAWFSLDSVVEPSWSVSAEAFAYLAFPTIAAFSFNRSPAALACLVFVAWCGLWCLAAAGVVYAQEADPSGPLDICFGPFPVVRCLCGFVAGICAYRLSCVPRMRVLLSRRGLAEGLLAAILALTCLTDLDVAVVVLFVPLVCSLSVPRHAASRWLRSGLAMWLGELSYALYLAHSVIALPVMKALMGRVSGGSVHLLGVVASFAAAIVLHELVEKPLRSLTRGRRPTAGMMTISVAATTPATLPTVS